MVKKCVAAYPFLDFVAEQRGGVVSPISPPARSPRVRDFCFSFKCYMIHINTPTGNHRSRLTSLATPRARRYTIAVSGPGNLSRISMFGYVAIRSLDMNTSIQRLSRNTLTLFYLISISCRRIAQ